jgi:hypothetical protein
MSDFTILKNNGKIITNDGKIMKYTPPMIKNISLETDNWTIETNESTGEGNTRFLNNENGDLNIRAYDTNPGGGGSTATLKVSYNHNLSGNYLNIKDFSYYILNGSIEIKDGDSGDVIYNEFNGSGNESISNYLLNNNTLIIEVNISNFDSTAEANLQIFESEIHSISENQL